MIDKLVKKKKATWLNIFKNEVRVEKLKELSEAWINALIQIETPLGYIIQTLYDT